MVQIIGKMHCSTPVGGLLEPASQIPQHYWRHVHVHCHDDAGDDDEDEDDDHDDLDCEVSSGSCLVLPPHVFP